ncbi:MAG: glycosyltransferase family 4 protein [Chloroflexota bacterium]
MAKRPLRVLMIAPTSFFSEYGGHIRIYEETRALQELGHEVTIVTYYMGNDIPGFDIRRTRPLPYRADYEVGSSRHKIAFDIYLAVQSLIEGLKVKPDIIHGHMHEGALIGGVLAKILRVPMVFDFQGSLTSEMVDHNFLNPNGRIFPWVFRLEKWISRQLSNRILTSSIQATQLLENDFDVPKKQIVALPDCADPIRFHPEVLTDEQKIRIKNRLGIPQDKTVITYLGLLTDYQGIPQLIDTAVYLKEANENVHFLVMGYPSVVHYKNLAYKKGISKMMTFTGKIPYKQAPQYLALGDISVAPKISSTEGSGKLLNYMAMAHPIVAFDTPVHREYLGDLGTYAPIGDVEAFAKGIQSHLPSETRRHILGQQLRKRAQRNYSWHQAGLCIEQVYENLTTPDTDVKIHVRV